MTEEMTIAALALTSIASELSPGRDQALAIYCRRGAVSERSVTLLQKYPSRWLYMNAYAYESGLGEYDDPAEFATESVEFYKIVSVEKIEKSALETCYCFDPEDLQKQE